MRVGVYARISSDDERDGLGVARQESDARTLCQRLGWTVADVYTDSSVSAYKRVVRPAWESMLSALESGELDGIACYDIDRIARQPRDLERLLDIYEKRPLVFATVQGALDLASPDGRFMARILVNVANKASSDTGRRVSRKALELAQNGKPNGGGTRPYGYVRGRMELNEPEAAIIRDFAVRLLAGESLTSICRSHNIQERSTMRRIMLRPSIAGLRSYKGSIMLGDDGSPVKAVWPAILDVPTWEAVKEVLTDPRREITNGRIDRKYLLSGFLRCKCSARMYGVFKKGAPNYMCPTDRGCGNCCRKAEPIDQHITELVLRYLERQNLYNEAENYTQPSDNYTSEIEQAQQSLANLIKEWDEGRMSDTVFFTAQAKKEATLNALKRQRAAGRRRQPITGNVRQQWAAANLSQKRAIISDVLLAVKVLEKPHTAPRKFEAKYLVPVWVEADSLSDAVEPWLSVVRD